MNTQSIQPAYLRTCVPAYLRTCVPAYLRTCVPAYLLLALTGNAFAADVSSENEYKTALGDALASSIVIKDDITLDPITRGTYGVIRSNGSPPNLLGLVSLEGDQTDPATLRALVGSGTASGPAFNALAVFAADEYQPSANVTYIRNLVVRDFNVKQPWSNGVFSLAEVSGDISNVHFRNNTVTAGVSALEVSSIGGGINNARFIGNTSFNDPALWVDQGISGGLNDSVFIGNKGELPGDFPTYDGLGAGTAGVSAAMLSGNVELKNNVFLANTSRLHNPQNSTLGQRGAALIHGTTPETGPASSTVKIIAETGQRTLFYGNTHDYGTGSTTGTGVKPSGIHFESEWDYDNDQLPAVAGNPMTASVTLDAQGTGSILMLDPLSSQRDGIAENKITSGAKVSHDGVDYEVRRHDLKYSPLTVNLTKTGTGDWFLGGESHMLGASNWSINAGTLTLATVNYGTLGVIPAAVNLSHGTTATFTLASGATLAGSGTIAAKTIALNGAVRPGTWGNTGTLASAITTDIPQANIDAIQVGKNSDYGTLTFKGDVTMSGAKYYANVKSATEKTLLDVQGKLTLSGSGNAVEITLTDDKDLENVAIINTTGGIESDFDAAKVEIKKPDFLLAATSASKLGNQFVVNVRNSGVNWNPGTTDPVDFTLADAADTFTITESLSGVKDLTKNGAGTLFLDGNNTYTGATTVDAGTLRVGSTETAGSTAQVASHVTVAKDATIGGHGTLAGGLTLEKDAILSPGASLGTLTVVGDLNLSQAIYQFEVAADGKSDGLVVKKDVSDTTATGKVTLGGTSTLDLQSSDTVWSTTRNYTVIDAGEVESTFTTVQKLTFMDPTLDYTSQPGKVLLTLTANDKKAASFATSRNQRGVGQAIDSLAMTHAVKAAINQLGGDAAAIRNAYDNFSGELHASARSAVLGNQRLRDMVQARMLGLGAGGLASAQPVLLASNGTTRANLASAPSQRLWANTWGYSGDTDGNSNVAKIDHSGIGLAFGGDARVSDDLTVGAVFGFENGKVKAGGTRRSRTDVDSYSVGGYLTGSAGDFALQGGVIYSWLDFDSSRNISVRAVTGKAKSSYKGSKVQAFVEGSRAFDASDSLTVTPYLNLTQSWLHTDKAREKGSAAALTVAAQNDSVFQTTLGVRTAYALPTATPVALTANLGWAHSFGDTKTKTRNSFGTGSRFTIAGTRIDRDRALVGVGLEASLAPNTTLAVGYDGQFGSNLTDHAGSVQVRVRF